jgi:hypothetical protein
MHNLHKLLKVVVKFTSEVAWLELRYLRVFSRHLKIGFFGDDLRNLLLSKFLPSVDGLGFLAPAERSGSSIFFPERV